MAAGTPVVVSRIQNRRGTQAQFNALYPTYPGSGNDILQPGEIALITDAPGRVFIGNINGTYLELTTSSSSSALAFTPLQISLIPSPSTWTPIPALIHTATPFLSILYSITDTPQSPINTPAPANAVGTFFSRNGELSITAIVDPMSSPPFPVTLSNTGTEINTSAVVPNPWAPPVSVVPDITFKADYNVSGDIQISYMHNFVSNLTFSTSSIIWLSI